MKYECVKTCGLYRKGHIYYLERPIPVLAMAAIRTGHLVAAQGWCAPSEAVYADVEPVKDGVLLELPQVQTVRGGIRFEDPTEPVKPKRKPRKKVAQPDTLESLAAQTAAGLDDLRGPASV